MEEAIQILCESKLLDRAYPGLVAHYSEQLISIYEMQSDNKACKEELMYYVFECPQTELVYIYKLNVRQEVVKVILGIGLIASQEMNSP